MSDAPFRIGLPRLADTASVVWAQAAGLFAAEGIEVELSVEPSWANLADKLAYGLLDAVVMLPPLVLAMHLGLRPAATPLIVPMSLSLNGLPITLATPLAAEILGAETHGGLPPTLEVGRRLRRVLTRRPRPTLAVVHFWSGHNLLLRYWLDACGIDPARDVEFAIIPPPQMPDALAAGRIDGFCAGPPWGAVAARAGHGRTVAVSSGIWRNHPEKCLAVRAAWADEHPARLQAVLRAVLRASRHCDDPAESPVLATRLAEPPYVNIPTEVLAACLPGDGTEGGQTDRSVFAAHAATFPWRSHARWFLAQMARWGELPAGLDAAAVATQVYRPDLYATAARAVGVPVPRMDLKTEGGHSTAWRLDADPAPIEMGPDLFCDGASFSF